MAAHDDPQADVRLDGFPAPADTEHVAARVDLELLASRFVEEIREGRHPSIDDWADRYPRQAEEIREFFPIVASLERWKTDKETECVRDTLPQKFEFEHIGPYEILGELGRGGMGVVFEAVRRPHRHVALKLLPWRFTADALQRKERFRNEAATIEKLRHPNIVPVYSFGEHSGYAYYAMRLVRGSTLAALIRLLRESPQPINVSQLSVAVPDPGELPTEALPVYARDSWTNFARIGLQVASALAYAHDHGVLHHDIKPANLLIDLDGRVVVTDFGVGKIAEEESQEKESDAGLGTLRYMAPERLGGHSDARSDLYSLGITLHELLTRTPAFEAADRDQLLTRVLRGELRPPRSVNREIPYDLETIVLTATALDPRDRYPSARHMAADLARFLNGDRPQARRPGWFRRLLRRLWKP